MLRKLLDLFRHDSLMTRALEKTRDMFGLAEEIYSRSIEVASGKRQDADTVYEMDRKINACEVDVRKTILQHVSINARQDIITAFILTTVIVDIERIGDYAKNIAELTSKYSGPKTVRMDEDLVGISSRIVSQFSACKRVFFEGEYAGGRELMNQLNGLRMECEQYILKLFESGDSISPHPMANVLFARYTKRVTAHLLNIVSGAVNSYDLIGFSPDAGAQKK